MNFLFENSNYGYPLVPVIEPESEGGDSESDSDSEEDEPVMETCGCVGTYGLQGCCEPNCPQKNSIEQFNVCPMKVHMLEFLCGND